MSVLQIREWDKCFEGSKSRGFNNKSSCQMPNKHGLGYRYLVRQKNGAAIFGAWCALVQVLSKQDKPRQGYCTDTGRIDGRPYTAIDLEMLTDIPAKVFEEMLQVCGSQQVGWIVSLQGYHEDTERIPRGHINSDSDLDLDLECPEPQCDSEPPVLTIPLISRDGEFNVMQADVDEWQNTFPGIDVLQSIKRCRLWNLDNPANRKTERGIRKHISAWLAKDQNSAKPKRESSNSQPSMPEFTL